MKSYLVIFIVLLYFVGIASAESGILTIDAGTTNSYSNAQSSSSNGNSLDMTRMYFDVANYNHITSLTNTWGASWTFANEAESTTFSISGNGNSGGGIASYDRLSRTGTLWFSSSDIIYSPVTITYSKNIFANISGGVGTIQKGGSVTSTTPVFFAGADTTLSKCATGGWTCSLVVNTQKTFSNNYQTSYSGGIVTVSIDKSISSVSSKIDVRNSTASKFLETTFNMASFNYSYEYDNQLYLNMSDASGNYDIQLINSSYPNAPIPAPTPVINPITHGGILWDKSNYSKNEIGTVSYMFDAGLFESWFAHWIDIEKDGVFVQKYEGLGVSGNIQYQFGSTGTYTAKYNKCLFLTCLLPSLIDSASVSVSISQSYIYVNSTVPTNYPVNVSYRLGYVPAIQLATNGIEVRQVSSGRLTTGCYNNNIVANTLYNCSITFPADGQYKIILREIGAGDVVSVYTMAIQQYNPPQENVSVSSISIDKFSYYTGDRMLIDFEIDSTNYSNFLTYYAFYNTTTGKNIANHKLNGQQVGTVENILGTYLDSWDYTRFISISGNYNISLRAKNNTVDFRLANQNFTFTNANRRGISMFLKSNSVCTAEAVTISYTIPETVNLTIQESYSGKILAVYRLNESGTLTYKINKVGVYLVSLQAVSDNSIQALDDFTVTKMCDVLPNATPKYIGINGTWTSTNENIKETCLYWDNWVRGIFGTQGVNDVTRILFALGAIVAMMFIGLIASKGNFGVAVILGFFPYAFFTYVTLSTPCGQYMPLWINIFIALIIGIKMKWFS